MSVAMEILSKSGGKRERDRAFSKKKKVGEVESKVKIHPRNQSQFQSNIHRPFRMSSCFLKTVTDGIGWQDNVT